MQTRTMLPTIALRIPPSASPNAEMEGEVVKSSTFNAGQAFLTTEMTTMTSTPTAARSGERRERLHHAVDDAPSP